VSSKGKAELAAAAAGLGEDGDSDEDSDGGGSQGSAGHTGLTESQNRLLYLISLYSHAARTEDEKEEWIRKQAVQVLIYEGIVLQVLDYDYAPSSEMIGVRRAAGAIAELFDAIALHPRKRNFQTIAFRADRLHLDRFAWRLGCSCSTHCVGVHTFQLS
jgi:hypothetical protein